MKCFACLIVLAIGSFALAQEAEPKLAFDLKAKQVTPAEVAAFKAYMVHHEPPVDGSGNVWVYGEPGKMLEALGMMYEITHDREILDRMLVYCDAALYARQDLLPADQGGQRKAWTGKVEPIWPSQKPNDQPAGAAVEQGQVLSHIANCVKLIDSDATLQNQSPAVPDPHHFGKTYGQRAATYLKQCDYVIDDWILPRFINAREQNHFYFPGPPNPYKPLEPTPWNQLFMLTNGLVRLADVHTILQDDPKRVARYESLVKSNVDWFLAKTKPQTSPSGSACWLWLYSLANGEGIEDTNHAAYDTEGLYLAFAADRYGLTREAILPLANTYLDIVLAKQTDGKFAGRVDGTTGTGHRGGDNYVRDEYLYNAMLRPESFERLAKIEIDSGKAFTSPVINARLLWLKKLRDSQH